MNNWFNFQKPYFNELYGSDWDSFDTIVEDNVDYLYQQNWRLYWLRDITLMRPQPLESALRLRGIKYDETTSTKIKKRNLRKFNTANKEKGMEDFYLDYQESVVGTRGAIYSGYELGSFVWDSSCWPISGTPESCDWVWTTTDAIFDIYIDCKTTNSDLLDELVEIYRQDFLLPAFYQIYLIDSDFTILRTV